MSTGTQISDAASGARHAAIKSAECMMANHLRKDHKMSVRQVARRLGVTDREVRDHTGESA